MESMKSLLVIVLLACLLVVSVCASCGQQQENCKCDCQGGTCSFSCDGSDAGGCGGGQGCSCEDAAKKGADTEDAKKRCESRTAGSPEADPIPASGSSVDEVEPEEREEEVVEEPSPAGITTEGATQVI